VGAVIDGKYELVAVLGTGGMGVVYEGRNLRILRRVAIKVLHATTAESGDAVARFEQEAQAAGRIGSKHIVEVLDLGHLPNGDRYMVMEYLEGESLRDRMDRVPRAAPLQLAPLISQLLEGLGAAHAAGVFHRDLKPENVFLQRTRGGDFVKLLDFGISKFTRDTNFSKTRTGSIFGTPYYMAPEHATGSKKVDHRVDIYAVGVIMYEALSGCLPFDGEVFTELLFKIALETPPSLQALRPDLHPDWVRLVERAMARQPEARFASAAEFRDALSAVVTSAASSSQPPAPTTVLLSSSASPPVALGTVRNWSHSQPAAAAPRRRAPVIALMGLVLATLGVAGWVMVGSKRSAPVGQVPSGTAPIVASPVAVAPAVIPSLVPLIVEKPAVSAEPAPALTSAPAPAVRLPSPPLRKTAPAASASAAAAPTPEAPAVRARRRLRRDL
jgi:serine/threonine-protein kinase